MDPTTVEWSTEPPRRVGRASWWAEFAVVAGLYGLYALGRNLFGSGQVRPAAAWQNAERVIDLEQALGIFHEATVQAWALSSEAVVTTLNTFYAVAHFVVPVVVLSTLYLRHPRHYLTWRTTLAFTTFLSLVIYAVFPVMPPRLIGSCGPYGACLPSDFVDTLSAFGGPWSFESASMASASNQFAAVPSLHMAWALWCCLAVYPLLQKPWNKAIAVAYPALTFAAIVVTGNHFFLDAAAGAAVLGAGHLFAGAIDRRRRTPGAGSSSLAAAPDLQRTTS